MDLTCKFQIEATLVANEFIDRYMADANGEYVKVYLYLLRHASEKLDVGTIADALNHTEADVKRAVLYWQKAGALKGAASLVGPKGANISARKNVVKSTSSPRARKTSVLTMEDLFSHEDQEVSESRDSRESEKSHLEPERTERIVMPAGQTEESSFNPDSREADREVRDSSETSERGTGGMFSIRTKGFASMRQTNSLGGLSALFGEVPIEQVRENSARVIGKRKGLTEEVFPETEENLQTSEQATQQKTNSEQAKPEQAEAQKESGQEESVKMPAGQDSEKKAEAQAQNQNVGEGMRTSAIWGREPRIRDAVPISSGESGVLSMMTDALKKPEPEKVEHSSDLSVKGMTDFLTADKNVDEKVLENAPEKVSRESLRENSKENSGEKQAETELKNSQNSKLADDEEFSQLLYIAQRYLNRIFTPRDVDIFANLYEGLHLSAEMLEYLVEYCVQNGHTSVRYIEAVGMNWHEKGFETVEEAKAYSTGFTRDAFAVMRAFGLNDRKPGDGEREMIEKWFQTYGFSRDLVVEACRRTMEATHNPSFRYADKILSDWRDAGAKTMEDINQMDEKRRAQNSQNRQSPRASVKTPVNRFHNFEQRSTDYDSLVLDQVKGWLGEQ